MTRRVHRIAMTRRPSSAAPLLRLFSCIRWDEILVLQGAPLIGVSFAIGAPTSGNFFALAVFGAASCCLVAHVFALNDWSGIDGDLNDPNRAARTFSAAGVSRKAFGLLVITLLAASLSLFALLGAAPLVLACAIAALGALYSAPAVHMKGRPVAGSLLHLAGGTLHFLLGYGTFAAIDARALAISLFFGLVFAAGHLTHETRDYAGDLANRIRTNAVAFGKRRAFLAGLVLFTAAYGLLTALALVGWAPRLLGFAAALYPLHLYASLSAMHAGLTFDAVGRLQTCYRLIYAVIGVVMVATLWLGYG